MTAVKIQWIQNKKKITIFYDEFIIIFDKLG